MLLVGDLGFSSLVLVVLLVLPLIGFFVRRKWRLSVAKQAEIQRLLILASEETARAELEATVGYGAVSISRNYHQCAVCYCPTTTRCARCKAVRYCSPKCQIFHWRQGHKEECYPPPVVACQNHDEGGGYGQKAIEQDQYGDGYENEENLDAKLTRTSSTESALFNSTTELALLCSSSSSVVLHGKDDAKVELHADGEGLNSAPESTTASFSGFSSSAADSESSDNVSVCESISSNEPDKSDSSFSTDANLDTFWTSSVVNNLDQTNPTSPKFVRLVDSVDKISKINKLNQAKPDQSGESQCRATSFSGSGGSDMYEGSIAEGSRLSSGFWDETLESVPSTNVADSESFNSYHKEGGKGASHDSGSSLHFSFTLPGSASSSHPHSSNMKDAKLDNAPQDATTSGHAKLSDGVTSSKNVGLDSLNVRNSKPSNSERANQVECGSNNISQAAKPKEAISTDVPLVSGLSSSCFEKSGSTDLVNGPSNASQTLKSSDAYSSNARVHVVPSVKSGKTDDVHANVAKLPQVSSSSNCKNGLKTVLKVVDQFRGSKLPKHHQHGAGNEEIFSYESFVKLYSSNKVELQPRGLINCGNSCYANAVLQCLTFTPPLTAYFLHGLHSKACAKKEWCFTCEFENLILKTEDGRSPLSPIGILSQLQNIGSQLSSGKEEDAHEFLRYAIDAMQSVCLKEAGVVSSSCIEEESTLIGLTFGGYLRSKIQCIKCLGKSERHERMMDLTVEIEGDIRTLEEALRRFTRTEILDGENKYQCSRCKSYEKAKKKLTILEAPNVLTIALKRFQSGKFGKLNKAIRFPEILNLAPYMSGTSDKSPIYKLYGVVVHLDIMNAAFSGHYLCYVKNAQNKWFKIDDSTVAPTELERVLTKGAYMLLYARCSPRAPRLLRNRNKSIPSRVHSKNPLKSSSSTHSDLDEFYPSLIHRDTHGSIGSFYSKYNHLQRILEDSSSSDSSSLFSSNSDEGSCCTDSTHDSTSADDLLDSIFGDSIYGCSSPWRGSDSDVSSSSSSSPLYSRHSPLADSNRYASGSPEIRSSRMNEGKGDGAFSHTDTSKQCRKVVVGLGKLTQRD
ncbi:hypothetical protein V6N13_065585 [Hibiscus sabdariffa]|uniref:Uncharacterized protein n=1 Tax=Hibiscus sabdariffa TaxID=183260 RepID=A0ABR2QQE9_9ROSI